MLFSALAIWLVGTTLYTLCESILEDRHTRPALRALLVLSLWFAGGGLFAAVGVVIALAITALLRRQPPQAIAVSAGQAAFALLPAVFTAAFLGNETTALWQIVALAAAGSAGYIVSRLVLRQGMRGQLFDLLLIAQVIPLAMLADNWLAALLLLGLFGVAARGAAPAPSMAVDVQGDALIAQIARAPDTDTLIDHTLNAADQMMQPDVVTFFQPGAETDYRVIRQQDGTRTEYTTDTLPTHIQQLLTQRKMITTNTPAGGILIAAPLDDDAQTVGVLSAEAPHAFSDEQRSAFRMLATHAAVRLITLRQLDEQQYQLQMLDHLRHLAVPQRGKSLAAMQVLETAMRTFDPHQAVLYHLNTDNNRLTLLVSPWQNAVEAEEKTLIPVQIEPELAADVIHDGRVRVVKRHQQRQQDTLVLAPVVRPPLLSEVLVLVFKGERVVSQQERDMVALLASQAASYIAAAASNEQMLTSRNRLRTILASIQDGVVLLDRSNRLIDYNPAAEKLLDLSLTDYLDTPFDDLPHTYQPLESDNALFGVSQEPTNEHRVFVRTMSSRTTYMEQVWLPTHDAHERIAGHVVVLRDITDDKRRIESRDEAMLQLVHDLRSPLGSVIAGLRFANDLVDAPDATTYLPEVLTVAYNSSRRLLRLINTLLDVEREELALECDIQHISHLAENAYVELSHTAKEANITITMAISDDLPYIYVDADKVQRVLINLLDNAIDYSEREVNVSAFASEEMLTVRVSDDGSGLPIDKRDTIFDKFAQGDDQKKRRGKHSGIGLAFCKRVVEAHGGIIQVVDGCALPGACFEFTLPRYSAETQRAE